MKLNLIILSIISLITLLTQVKESLTSTLKSSFTFKESSRDHSYVNNNNKAKVKKSQFKKGKSKSKSKKSKTNTVASTELGSLAKANTRTLFNEVNPEKELSEVEKVEKEALRRTLAQFLNETKFPAEGKECDKKNEKVPSKIANITETETNITAYNITKPLVIIPSSSPVCNEEWDYRQNGQNWECICEEGLEQSPIDLPRPKNATLAPIKPIFKYDAVSPDENNYSIDNINAIKVDNEPDNTVKIRYHNNAIKILYENLGKITKLDGSWYVAEEIQFHTPSEHTIDGERFDMEMQVIHYGHSKGDIAKQTVLSFLFKKTPGKYNKFIDSLDFYSLPNPVDNFRELYNNLYIPNVLYSSDEEQIPTLKPFSFYTYEGSLTFPPCTERTTWYVASEPIPLSSTAIELFREALRKPDQIDEKGNIEVDKSPIIENYRETKPLNDREVFFYDHTKYDCPKFEIKSKKVKPSGHYEKHVKDVTNYIYVNSAKPSGIPGALLVTKDEAEKNKPKTQEDSDNSEVEGVKDSLETSNNQ